MRGSQLFSLIEPDGTLVLYTETVDTGPPGPDEVIVRIDAVPLHPSNQSTLLASADLETIQASGTSDQPVVKATIPADRLPDLAGRIGVPLAVGGEGAGVVVASGENTRHLVGKTVACLGQAMFADYIRVPAKACHILPEGVSAAAGAASLINPLTAFAMVDTMRAERHSALVHTAPASSLGQMLNRICLEDGVPLVNVVRRREQADLLRNQGASHVCVTSDANSSLTFSKGSRKRRRRSRSMPSAAVR